MKLTKTPTEIPHYRPNLSCLVTAANVYIRKAENTSALSPTGVSLCLNKFCLQILEIVEGLNVVDVSSSIRLMMSGEPR